MDITHLPDELINIILESEYEFTIDDPKYSFIYKDQKIKIGFVFILIISNREFEYNFIICSKTIFENGKFYNKDISKINNFYNNLFLELLSPYDFSNGYPQMTEKIIIKILPNKIQIDNIFIPRYALKNLLKFIEKFKQIISYELDIDYFKKINKLRDFQLDNYPLVNLYGYNKITDELFEESLYANFYPLYYNDHYTIYILIYNNYHMESKSIENMNYKQKQKQNTKHNYEYKNSKNKISIKYCQKLLCQEILDINHYLKLQNINFNLNWWDKILNIYFDIVLIYGKFQYVFHIKYGERFYNFPYFNIENKKIKRILRKIGKELNYELKYQISKLSYLYRPFNYNKKEVIIKLLPDNRYQFGNIIMPAKSKNIIKKFFIDFSKILEFNLEMDYFDQIRKWMEIYETPHRYNLIKWPDFIQFHDYIKINYHELTKFMLEINLSDEMFPLKKNHEDIYPICYNKQFIICIVILNNFIESTACFTRKY